MIFNGVAKEKFEEWALNNVKTHLVKKMKLKPNTMVWVFDNDFYKLPLSMQWGIYQDFADSLDIYINAELHFNFGDERYEAYEIWILDKKDFHKPGLHHSYHETLNEARTKAIDGFNEIINNNAQTNTIIPPGTKE